MKPKDILLALTAYTHTLKKKYKNIKIRPTN